MKKAATKIWISTAFKNPRYYFNHMLTMPNDEPGANATDAQDEEIIRVEKKYKLGEPLTAEEAPLKYCARYRDAKIKKVPDFIYCYGFFVVSRAFVEVLKAFDLGAGGAHPIQIFQWDRKTSFVDGSYYMLYFGAVKSAFNLEASNPAKLVQYGPGAGNRWSPQNPIEDMDVALDVEAATTGSDLWMDSQVTEAFFLSDRLVQALKAAKFTSRMTLTLCKLT